MLFVALQIQLQFLKKEIPLCLVAERIAPDGVHIADNAEFLQHPTIWYNCIFKIFGVEFPNVVSRYYKI